MPSSRNKCLLLTSAWLLLCSHAPAGGHNKNIPRQLPAGAPQTAALQQAGADCDEPPFCQEPDQGPHGGFPLVHSDAVYGSSAAESFTLAVPGQIDQVRWWGAYFLATELNPCGTILDDNFTLTIHTDAGGQLGAIVSTHPLGSSATRIRTGNQVPFFGMLFDEHRYTADLLQPFVAGAGQTYWVVIEEMDVDPCTWWWETAPQGTFGDGSTLWDQNGGGYLLENFDLALCINPIDDCNGNGVCDSLDIKNRISLDCNGNAVPDKCEAIALGDFNADGAVRLDDYEWFTACMAGPALPPMPEPLKCGFACVDAFDFGLNDTVDLRDFASFQAVFSY